MWGMWGLGVQDLECPLVEEGLPDTHEGLCSVPAFKKWGENPNILVADPASYIGTKSFPNYACVYFQHCHLVNNFLH